MRNLWNTLLHRWRFWQQTHDPEADFVVHRPHKRKHSNHFQSQPTLNRLAVQIAFCLCAVLFLLSIIALVTYLASYIGSRQASETMRNAYYAEQSAPAEPPTPAASHVSAQSPAVTPAPTVIPSSVPTATMPTRLEPVRYPLNALNIISKRFEKLRRQNKDIIGWLTIEGMLDEAVVQRDNDYYLNRDYRGYHNVNGAIFLDQHCDLSSRPYTFLVYGHNMKSGLMFGSLRNYEDITFYRNNPFITFDTLYEDGRYVIFAVSLVSTDPSNWRFLNFTSLCSPLIDERKAELKTLFYRSRYLSTVDVQPEDQLLLLITCASSDTERRVIAARRIRDGETEADLRKQIQKTTLR